MKRKLLLLSLITCLFFSCKKETATVCYECKTYADRNEYRDAGCYDKATWDARQQTDLIGNDLDKNKDCRSK